jgi:hypothetical protein
LTSLGIGASLVNHDIIFSDPEEVAHMTPSLCLPAASFLTGAIPPGRWRPDGPQRLTAGMRRLYPSEECICED